MIRIAHRGASGSAPENTITAFKKAIEIGTHAVELDLRRTADDEIVVIHDATLDRTTNLHGPVNQATLADIKRADAGAWFDAEFTGEPVPTLTETLECIIYKTMPVLEIKEPEIGEAVVNKIREFELSVQRGGNPTNMLAWVVIISFHAPVLKTVREMDPSISTGWLIGSQNGDASPAQLCEHLRTLGSRILNVNHLMITSEFVREARQRGITLWCWTVDDIARMRELKTLGVHGITSNYPERFAAI